MCNCKNDIGTDKDPCRNKKLFVLILTSDESDEEMGKFLYVVFGNLQWHFSQQANLFSHSTFFLKGNEWNIFAHVGWMLIWTPFHDDDIMIMISINGHLISTQTNTW